MGVRPLVVRFVGGAQGPWRVERMADVRGPGMPAVRRLAVLEGPDAETPPQATWILKGVTSSERYITRHEQEALAAVQEGLGRPSATRAALIPITKSDAWWALAQDERQAIFGERSHHVATGLRVLPAVARRLHHGRDLGEPFDFLTWFEYAPDAALGFEDLVRALRATEEWRYVEREIDIRLVREPDG